MFRLVRTRAAFFVTDGILFFLSFRAVASVCYPIDFFWTTVGNVILARAIRAIACCKPSVSAALCVASMRNDFGEVNVFESLFIQSS